MLDDNDLTASSAHIADSEIAAAIRYLDPAPNNPMAGESDDTAIVVVFSILVFLLAAMPFISLYLRSS